MHSTDFIVSTPSKPGCQICISPSLPAPLAKSIWINSKYCILVFASFQLNQYFSLFCIPWHMSKKFCAIQHLVWIGNMSKMCCGRNEREIITSHLSIYLCVSASDRQGDILKHIMWAATNMYVSQVKGNRQFAWELWGHFIVSIS